MFLKCRKATKLMPCTKEKVALSLCWPEDSCKHALINICGGQASVNFFHAVKYAIDHFKFPHNLSSYNQLKALSYDPS